MRWVATAPAILLALLWWAVVDLVPAVESADLAPYRVRGETWPQQATAPMTTTVAFPVNPTPLPAPTTFPFPLPSSGSLADWRDLLTHWFDWLTPRAGLVGALSLVVLLGILLYVAHSVVKEATKDVYTQVKTLAGRLAQRGWNRLRPNRVVERTLTGLARQLRAEDPSHGLRHYQQLLGATEPPWDEPRFQARLAATWQAASSVRLKQFARLVEAFEGGQLMDEVRSLGEGGTGEALLWAYNTLDREYRLQALDVFRAVGLQDDALAQRLDDAMRTLQEEPYRAILRPYPEIAMGQVKSEIELSGGEARAVHYLGLETGPFGPDRAEDDPLLLRRIVAPPLAASARTARFTIVLGAPGSGRTTAALYWAWQSLRQHDLFPVYLPVTLQSCSARTWLNMMGRAVANTLLAYISLCPREFLAQEAERQAAIAHVLHQYLRDSLATRLQAAGLPRTGQGAEVLAELEKVKDVSFVQAPNDDELRARLCAALPQGFSHLLLLLDVQAKADCRPGHVQRLVDVAESLAAAGVRVKVLLPAACEAALSQDHTEAVGSRVALWWTADRLGQALQRFIRLSGDDSLASWCVGEARREVEARLIGAAHGTPRGLVHLGRALLERIGEQEPLQRLTTEDLDDVLGPPVIAK